MIEVLQLKNKSIGKTSIWIFASSLVWMFASNGTCADVSWLDFERDVVPIFQNRCLECHVGETAKNDFRITDREALFGYIEPGSSAGSSLWNEYLTATPRSQQSDSLVMPPTGPLPAAELSVLKAWIDGGAKWPEGVTISNNRIAIAPSADIADTKLTSRMFGAIGYLHPAVVHFPIVLLMFGGGAAFISYFTGLRSQWVAFQCLLWGSLFCVLASVMGWSFAVEKGYPNWTAIPDATDYAERITFFRHRWLGVSISVLSVLCSIVALFGRKPSSRTLSNIWRIGLICLALLVGAVGHQGGSLVYGDLSVKAFERLMGK